MTAAVTTGPSAYWYLTRGTGTIALILLTLSVALGVANVRRLRTKNVPRFVIERVHRNVSLLAMAFLVVHILTSVLDRFAPVTLVNAVIPFSGSYRPLWLGFGAVAFDLLVAIVITSLLRRHFGYRAWRATHWAVYASWPFAFLHGLGTGSDTKTGWMLLIAGGCVIVMIVAVVTRATAGWPHHPAARLGALGASALVPLALLVWLPSGPLAAGWAREAGTPASLLVRTSSGSGVSGSSSAPGGSPSSTPSGFTARASGTVRQGESDDGLITVDISLKLPGHPLSQLRMRLHGEPIDGGGIQMTSSEVTLGTQANPDQYSGHVTSLHGTNIAAQVSDGQGRMLNLTAELNIDPNSGLVSGTVRVRS
jgi:methionine sulfoxide reductase heme-binding subunit